MGLKLSSIRIDQSKATEGTWGSFAGAKFLIRRYNAPEVEALRNKLVLENLELIQSGTDEAETKATEIDNIVLSQAVLLNWEGVENEDGSPLPFTPEAAKNLFEDKSLAELRQFVQSHSVNRASYLVKTEEQVAEQVKTTADS